MTEDLSGLPNLEGLLPLAQPAGMEGWPLVNTYSYVYVLAYRDEADLARIGIALTRAYLPDAGMRELMKLGAGRGA